MKQDHSLNLSRKWRSSQFKELVGQELAVRILQNSLFKGYFFPVYLFAGQKGCGKTSTARIFAAAVNCKKLEDFQKDHTVALPCLTCDSCEAFYHIQHPDFIEIDAASHTGVDNIRSIIDTSAFLPVLGSKKIYLIDEVHMLSKAAFNAFLKILEEPPRSVIFILATTELQKIPETIKSRCLQLFFNAIDIQKVAAHLSFIGQQEGIDCSESAYQLIAQVTQGSLRDALNLLEQARFAQAQVTDQTVYDVLGYVDDQTLLMLLRAVFDVRVQEVLDLFSKFEQKNVSVDFVVKRLLEFLYDGIVLLYGAKPRYNPSMVDDLTVLTQGKTIKDLLLWHDAISRLLDLLPKTTKKMMLFESSIVRILMDDRPSDMLEDKKKRI